MLIIVNNLANILVKISILGYFKYVDLNLEYKCGIKYSHHTNCYIVKYNNLIIYYIMGRILWATQILLSNILLCIVVYKLVTINNLLIK